MPINIVYSMLGELVVNILKYFSKHKVLFFSMLFSIVGILSIGISRITINDSIYAVMPKGENFEEFNRLVGNKGLTGRVILNLAVSCVRIADIEVAEE